MPIFIVLLSILLFSEIVSYFASRNFFMGSSSVFRWFNWIWVTSTILLYVFLFISRSFESNFLRNIIVNIFMMFLLLKLFTALIYTITSGIQLINSYFVVRETLSYDSSRRMFASRMAMSLAVIPFTGMVWGLIKTAYDFKIHLVKVNHKKVPSSFKGLKIIQLSDIHTGSLQGEKQLRKAVDIVNALKPDMILFTGDLVNNETDEALPYISVLKELIAPMGIYSVLGNHDYGDYHDWRNDEEKAENMDKMYRVHQDLGWRLLLNEHLRIEKEGQNIALIGIENWGANLNFKKYGNLPKAYEGLEASEFKILLSHDPSHWSHEVKDKFYDIDLTLSGHTHGFQFGIEIPGFRWSPSQYIYPQWAGLYKNGEQLLYVNRGLGCLGYMGRIGIRPEITLIEL